MIISLRERIGLLFVAFFLLVAVSVAAMVLVIEAQQKDALVINLAGRQRMLLQAMTRHALELEKRLDEVQHRTALIEAAGVFESTLDALENGGPAPYTAQQTVSLPETRDLTARARLQEVRRRWELLYRELNTLASTPPDDPAFTAAVVAVEQQSTPLVEAMDEAVRAFEQLATAKVQRLRLMQGLFLLAAALLVVLGYGMVYRMVIRPLRLLQQVAAGIGDGRLDRPVPTLGRDEIGQLAQSLEAMRRRLHAAWENLEDQVARRTRELEALYQVSREISSRLDIEHVLRSVTEKARELLGGEIAAICLPDQGGETLAIRAFSGPPYALRHGRSSIHKPLQAQVLAQDHALACGVSGCVGGCDILTKEFQTSHLAAPLRIGGRVIGALCVGSPKERLFATEAANLLTKLADSAVIALENARLYAQAERVAILEERQRIAAEMHDGLAQTLSFLGLKVDRVAELVESGRGTDAVSELQHIQAVVDQAVQAVRRSIANWQGEPQTPQSLRERLESMLRELAADGTPAIQLVAEGKLPLILPHEDAEQVVRVVREAVVNTCRHARATRVSIRLTQERGQATVVVEDDGCGFDPEAVRDSSGHFGLLIMRARAARLGGHLTVDSRPGGGTRVVLTWPLWKENPAHAGLAVLGG